MTLQDARRARGLSQKALGAAVGVSKQAVGQYEAGRVQPSLRVAQALARVLGVTVEELFGEVTR